jgi:hypothetical protein
MIVYIMGGLGNQMFQYAAGLGAATILGETLELNTTFYQQNKNRKYELGVFPISFQVTNNVAEPIKEKQHSYQEITQSGMMVGYWQSEKYFDHIADTIRQEFKLPKATGISDDMVAVTVRRGDYLSLPDVFAQLDESYYGEARKNFPEGFFVVFSDDPEWCAKNLEWADLVMPCSNPVQDMALLSSFKNHIIANSSYGWWGAWLADGNKVIAPKKWFTNGLDDSDLIPDRWIKL